MVLVVGSYSESTEPGIHFYRWEASGGEFLPVGTIKGIENPSYVTPSKEGEVKLLYAVMENKQDAAGLMDIYTVEEGGAKTSLSARITYEGAGSCYISTDAAGIFAFIANYGGGTLTALRLPQGSTPGAEAQQLKFDGNGPVEDRQDQSHIHAALLSNDEQYLYCSDLGADRLYRFKYDQGADLPLQESQPPYLQLPPGSGPRHMAFSPDGRYLYLLTELSGEIFVFDAQEFQTGWLQKISVVEGDFTGKIEGGDIQVHPNGRFLYASNRGDANEIIVFAIDAQEGELRFQQRIDVEGRSPRNLLICDQQELLLAANEQSDNISIFKLHNDGYLEFTGKHLKVIEPTCLKILVQD